MMFLLTAHFVSTIVIWGVQCVPIYKFWDPFYQGGYCINLAEWALCESPNPPHVTRIALIFFRF